MPLLFVECISWPASTSNFNASTVAFAIPVKLVVTVLSDKETSPDKLPVNCPKPCTLNSWLSKLDNWVATPFKLL